MGIVGTLVDWVKEHKLLTGVGVAAAGLGYLTVSSTAHAAPPPKLPGTSGVTPLPGGGLGVQTNSGTVVVPPPSSVQSGNALYVTTQDAAPYGNLNARESSDPNSRIVGYYPKDGAVQLIAGPENGMLHVKGPGIVGNQAVTLEAWASMAFLKPRGGDMNLSEATQILKNLGLV
jgi:hypothetical protein